MCLYRNSHQVCHGKLMKKALRETQTLHAGCSKAHPKIFIPPQTPFPGARDGQNLISWRWSLSSPTDTVWWGSMHAISSYRGNRPTNKQKTNTHTYKHTHKPTDRNDYNTLCHSFTSAQCKVWQSYWENKKDAVFLWIWCTCSLVACLSFWMLSLSCAFASRYSSL